jgi:hypothetical protein
MIQDSRFKVVHMMARLLRQFATFNTTQRYRLIAIKTISIAVSCFSLVCHRKRYRASVPESDEFVPDHRTLVLALMRLTTRNIDCLTALRSTFNVCFNGDTPDHECPRDIRQPG